MSNTLRVRSVLSFSLCLVSAASVASAQPAQEFYKDGKLTIVVSAGAGGAYGLATRIFAQRFESNLPGKATVVPQFMPGAGGLKAANYIYNAAPRDGSHLGLLLVQVPLTQVLGGGGVKYDATKFAYIGSIGPVPSTLSVYHTAPAKTFAVAKQREVILGSTGTAGATYVVPMLLNAFLGTNFKVVTGYPGSSEMRVAMERGEIHGMFVTWLSWKATGADLLREKKLVQLAQMSEKRMPELKDVPTLTELATTAEEKEILDLITGTASIGWAFNLPPGVPQDRVDLLRTAFAKTMKDPKFVSAANASFIDVEPATGPQVEKIVRQMASTSPGVIAKARAALGMK